MPGTEIQELLRRLTPQVFGAIVRRYGHFDTAEDATQEALIAAAMQWPQDGLPDNPRAWLITVASRRMIDLLRSEQARQRREATVAQWTLPDQRLATAADRPAADADDTLILLFMCCHPSLSSASQIALTLRAVGGLTTAEVARAFLVSEETMTRRISRAKQQIKASGLPFRMPPAAERAHRHGTVLHVLYLIFSEGYASTAGPSLYRTELVAEAIRLARMLHRLLPADGEVTGLLALMLLTEARRPGLTRADGELVPLAEQDRARWERQLISEGVALITDALRRSRLGEYQLQAAIAAVHDQAPSCADTEWPQIVALYGLLEQMSDNPMVRLNRAVAVAMASGPADGLARLVGIDALGDHHRLHSVRAHLLEMAGNVGAALDEFHTAAERTNNLRERDYLTMRAAQLASKAAGPARHG